MTRDEVDKAAGQTPCLCGDIETWHPECYSMFLGRPEHEIKEAKTHAYAIARRKLRERAKKAADGLLVRVSS